MTEAELEQLVAQIGEQILSRVQPSARRGEGLNIAELVCPDCTGRCAQSVGRCTGHCAQSPRAGGQPQRFAKDAGLCHA